MNRLLMLGPAPGTRGWRRANGRPEWAGEHSARLTGLLECVRRSTLRPTHCPPLWRALSTVLTVVSAFASAIIADSASAAAPSTTHLVEGVWQTTDFQNPDNPGCSIGGPGSIPGSRLILGVSRAHPSPLDLVLRKTAWVIPEGTPVRVLFTFGDGSTISSVGRGRGSIVEIEIGADQQRSWVHEFTANSSMQVSFDGNELPWRFDLAGTSAAINAMGDCLTAHQIDNAGPPFDGSAAVTSTQPFEPSGTQRQAQESVNSPTTSESPTGSVAPNTAQASATRLPAPGPEKLIASWGGSSQLQTRPFHVDGPWELQWRTEKGYFSARLHNAAGESGQSQLLANTTGAGASSSYQPVGGDFYMEFNASQEWSARIVSLQDVAISSSGANPPPAIVPPSIAPVVTSPALVAPKTPQPPPQETTASAGASELPTIRDASQNNEALFQRDFNRLRKFGFRRGG